MDRSQMSNVIAAIGGLGVAAFGLVDASKAVCGGVNHFGFKTIRGCLSKYVPEKPTNGMGRNEVLETLRQNWFNGTDLASQKAIAKSLIKLSFNPTTAGDMANVTGVDSNVLVQAATNMASGTTLTSQQSDLYARFDLILTAELDGTYQHADQSYRNATRACAMIVAVVLSIGGMLILRQPPSVNATLRCWDVLEALGIGLIATPLAPSAKDLSTALATAVNTLQLVNKP